MAYDSKLLGAVCRTFVDAVLAWYRRDALPCLTNDDVAEVLRARGRGGR